MSMMDQINFSDNDIKGLQEKKQKRLKFLIRLYELTDGYTSKLVEMRQISKDLGFSHDESVSIIQYLAAEDFIMSLGGWTLEIKHDGINEAEEAILKLKEPAVLYNKVLEKKQKRAKFLFHFYKVTDDERFREADMWQVGQDLEYSEEETEKIVQYLDGEYLIKSNVSGGIELTNEGVNEIENQLSEKDEEDIIIRVYSDIEEEILEIEPKDRCDHHELAAAHEIIKRQKRKIKYKDLTEEKLKVLIDENRFKNGKHNYSAIGRELGCNHETAKRYVSELGLRTY